VAFSLVYLGLCRVLALVVSSRRNNVAPRMSRKSRHRVPRRQSALVLVTTYENTIARQLAEDTPRVF